MDAATKRLRAGAERLGVALDDRQVDQLRRYVALLLEWNERINLTAVTEPPLIVDRHLLDSLALVPIVRDAATLVDVGAGAGLPGVVLAIACPGLRVTCVEAIRKKAHFLSAVRREVVDLEVIAGRVEGLTGRTFDVAVSRATWDPATWLPIGARLVRPGGRLLALQGAEQPALAAPAGFRPAGVHDWTLEDRTRRAVVFERSAEGG